MYGKERIMYKLPEISQIEKHAKTTRQNDTCNDEIKLEKLQRKNKMSGFEA